MNPIINTQVDIPARLAAQRCVMVSVQLSPNIQRRFVKRWVVQQLQDLWLTNEKSIHQMDKPWVLLIATQGSEPHLPVQAWLVWSYEKDRPINVIGKLTVV